MRPNRVGARRLITDTPRAHFPSSSIIIRMIRRDGTPTPLDIYGLFIFTGSGCLPGASMLHSLGELHHELRFYCSFPFSPTRTAHKLRRTIRTGMAIYGVSFTF